MTLGDVLRQHRQVRKPLSDDRLSELPDRAPRRTGPGSGTGDRRPGAHGIRPPGRSVVS
ncbi:hypothetical protein [Streptomyces sp. NPDC005336]|uniref:hypothetical protein n=1 Tax=Streptomyces sp. NPDC005336 TaxID=3157035 RepID=UPI0033BC2E51